MFLLQGSSNRLAKPSLHALAPQLAFLNEPQIYTFSVENFALET